MDFFAAAFGGAGAEARVFEFGDGRGLLEVGEGVGVVDDVFAVEGVGGGGELVEGGLPRGKDLAGEVRACFALALQRSVGAGERRRGEAAIISSRLRSARTTSEYFQLRTSPCSVMRSSPVKLSMGWAKMARWVGPPPRPTVPPRPWKRRRVTPHSRATWWRARWAL